MVFGKVYKDSLRNLLSNEQLHDSIRMDVYGKLAAEVYLYSDLDSASYFTDLLLTLATDQKNIKEEGSAHYMMGQIAYLKGDFPGALKSALEARKRTAQINYSQGESACLGMIGNVFVQMRNLDKAMEYYQLELELERKIDDRYGVGACYGNISTIYEYQHKPEMALTYRLKAISVAKEIKDSLLLTNELSNLALLYMDRERFDTSMIIFEEALLISKRIEDHLGVYYSEHGIGRIYELTNQLNKALIHFEKAVKIAKEREYMEELSSEYEVLGRINKKLKNYRAALEYFELHRAIQDSIINEKEYRDIADQEANDRYEKKALIDSLHFAGQQDVLQVENQKQKVQLYGLIGLIVLSVLFTLFIINRLRVSSRQRKMIQAKDEEKELLLKEIHHRVKNNLQIVSSLLSLQTRNIEDPSALSVMEDGQSRVQAMALIHESLYQSEDLAYVDFEVYLNKLLNQIAMVYVDQVQPIYKIETDLVKLDIDTAVPLSLILNELISNSFKYGMSSEHPELHITLKRLDQHYSLEVADGGPGLPVDFKIEKAKSLGLRLVGRLCKQLFGTLEYNYENGAKFNVKFQDTATRMLQG